MADYYSVIRSAVAGLKKNSDDSRRALYERARAALAEHVRIVIPPLPPLEVARQRDALEAAIRKIELQALHRIDSMVELATLVGYSANELDELCVGTASPDVTT